jgi:hypothetical protein
MPFIWRELFVEEGSTHGLSAASNPISILRLPLVAEAALEGCPMPPPYPL